ncbi:M56 family metallopeptidase [Luteibacter aegosomatissinici]|uniref:M56 family metallopeptidase n=1 Tax=Luteibacter aegosomatissinici TaxID=2911539 RepID=UPI001FFC1B03|nr:M56 family metallopeptidase [Luteibacter aegosomatissinici]UPG94321.1 M56 family metallopeptidase [Luteibacter aegosomatissinici]
MLAWMIYAALVALALCAAAVLAEEALRARRMPTRWPWIIAMALSLLLPVGMAMVPPGAPEAHASAPATATAALHTKAAIPLASAVIDWSGARPYTSSAPVNLVLKDLWFASSITLLLFLGVSTTLFHRRKRGWATGQVCDVPVLVSPDVGPAVVGLMRSRIVVPAWVLQESAAQQRYVMAHEQSHLNARDPLLVATALVLLGAMPWNPLLWWQCHRLRRAIEVDCDARVLRGGGDIGDYCETLIQVGQNQSEYMGAVTAMSESRSFLEQRIRIMLSKPRKWAGAFAFVLISLAIGMAVFAAQVTPPAASTPPTPGTVAIDPALLDAYTGEYRLSDYSLVTVARRGDVLTVAPIGQFMAQGVIDAPTLSDTEFSIPSIDAKLTFAKGANGHGSAMDVYIHGWLVATADRVDEATAEQIRRDLVAHVKNQVAFPNSEKALQLILNNQYDAAMMSHYAKGGPGDPDSQKDYYARLGPVESYKFEGVTDYGWDIYDVQHAHGAQQVFIQMDKNGLMVSSVKRRQ